ncbi:hypothetical protein A9Q99_10775 [Gammaproteobacteria bacterium 45_16_T64]|nr:hypothetical protein A9Q99_10775 [Gammaproteobacteria bacterium 45_16_T64]
MITLHNNPALSSLLRSLTIVVFSLFLAACGSGGTGEDTTEGDGGSNNGSTGQEDELSSLQQYNTSESKPQPANDDVRAFMNNVWANVVDEDRCGSCHSPGVGNSPMFARDDDVNLAYNAALGVRNLESPSSSLMVTQVQSGHNCWTDSPDDCAADMTQWITNWATASNGSVSNVVQLVAPEVHEVDDAKILPTDSIPTGYSTLHTLLTDNCAGCHIETADDAQSPFFAVASEADSYDAIRSKIDLEDEDRSLNAALSRIVVRLRSESHNCWSASCTSDATDLLNAIKTIATGIVAQEVDPALEISKGVQLGVDGLPANTGGRHETAMIARWEFKEGSGSSSRDTSGIEPLMDLQFAGDVSWVGGWGINLAGGRAQATTSSSSKLYNKIADTAQYSIEAWLAPNNVTQEGPARIISYSAGDDNANFLLGQTQYNYDFLHRSENSNETGSPALSTADADERLQATLQHIVVTYDQTNGRRIYVNGEYTTDVDPAPGTSINDWSNSYQFILGTADVDFTWLGVVRMVTIHNQALSQEEITQNFEAGVGQKFLLLFNVTDLVGLDDCWDSFVVFEAAEYDSYSYLFNQPYFARLYEQKAAGAGVAEACTAETAPTPSTFSFSLKDMRLGINGEVAATGQGFQKLDTTVTADRQILSNIGTIINQQNGPDSDQFFLAFGELAGNPGVYTDPTSLTLADPIASTISELSGVRTFEEINASLETMTTVPSTTSSIAALYDTVKQQLPVDEAITDFVAAQQMAIAQLAMLYCSELVDDTAKRDAYFPAFNFNETPDDAFDSTAKRDAIYVPLLNHMSDTSDDTNLTAADLSTSLGELLDGVTGRSGLIDCSSDCSTTRTETIVKAMCASTAASAAMLIQ